jgi:RimJ/RimL family protein N-acetyltransferase
MPVLETPRLYLATWKPEDWREFHRIAGDPLVMRFIGDGRPWTEERTREFVTEQIRGMYARGFCLWKLLDQATGCLIGQCGFQLGEHPEGAAEEIEMAWWLAPAFWGLGLATEAAQAALDYGFRVLHLDRVVAVAYEENVASIRVMEKLAFRLAERFRENDRPAVKYVLYRSAPIRAGGQ